MAKSVTTKSVSRRGATQPEGNRQKLLILLGVVALLLVITLWINFGGASGEERPPAPPAAAQPAGAAAPADPNKPRIVIGDEAGAQPAPTEAAPDAPGGAEPGKKRETPKGVRTEPAGDFTEGKVG